MQIDELSSVVDLLPGHAILNVSDNKVSLIHEPLCDRIATLDPLKILLVHTQSILTNILMKTESKIGMNIKHFLLKLMKIITET